LNATGAALVDRITGDWTGARDDGALVTSWTGDNVGALLETLTGTSGSTCGTGIVTGVRVVIVAVVTGAAVAATCGCRVGARDVGLLVDGDAVFAATATGARVAGAVVIATSGAWTGASVAKV
jgi:hypothetical protein